MKAVFPTPESPNKIILKENSSILLQKILSKPTAKDNSIGQTDWGTQKYKTADRRLTL
jgi:hypothetical protein